MLLVMSSTAPFFSYKVVIADGSRYDGGRAFTSLSGSCVFSRAASFLLATVYEGGVRSVVVIVVAERLVRHMLLVGNCVRCICRRVRLELKAVNCTNESPTREYFDIYIIAHLEQSSGYATLMGQFTTLQPRRLIWASCTRSARTPPG